MQKVTCPCDRWPQSGDVYCCDTCNMTVLVIRECKCDDPKCVSLACCGQAMELVNPAATT